MSKFDSGKPCFSLIEPNFALELAKVLTMGAEKYGPEDWKPQITHTGAILMLCIVT